MTKIEPVIQQSAQTVARNLPVSDEVAIRLVDISKKYRLFNSRKEQILELLHPFNRTRHREHWSLRDINLTIRRGATVGILGRNGSGKSTLLQIICSILRPTSGSCAVNGRIAALLELGAGFNPDLTGRDNVVTNALIMGLNSREIELRLDEVESFADIGEYFDQPVKTYSSGMFMRVAFAAAVHVDPDILIIDEAMAVGDAKFQEKCFRRMRSFQEQGKTILYVTHDRASVTYFCDEAILLHDGRLIETGEPRRIIDLYSQVLTTGKLSSDTLQAPEQPKSALTTLPVPAEEAVVAGATKEAHPAEIDAFLENKQAEDRCALNPLYNPNEHRFGCGGAQIIDFLVLDGKKINPGHVLTGGVVDLYLKIFFETAFEAPLIGLTFTNAQGVVLFGTHSGWLGERSDDVAAGEIRCYRFRVKLNLAVGPWFVEVAVARSQAEVSDLRSKMILVEILRDKMMIGLAGLDTSFEQIS